MKGWVYVISNKGMPGLVKVGFTTKDPELRADKLRHTGAAHPYLVEYEMQAEQPRAIEQKAHKLLFSHHEGKEWFRCSLEMAMAAIKQAAEDRVITERYKEVERAEAEAPYLEKEEKETYGYERLLSGNQGCASKDWYQETLTVIGTRGRRGTIRNKLNLIASKADDSKLRLLAQKAIDALDMTSTNPLHTELNKMTCMRNIPIERYCNECLGRISER